jgi:alkanesulfonate monooxygenase SsuD/methylene tetrahydromethanopterin reductase-like flavin-dependent oxidoreductase (luciferase family)
MPSSLGPEVGAAVAPGVERLGYDTFWSNDGRAGPGLPILAAAQKVTTRIRLGVGVIPVDVRPADEIDRTVRELGLDLGRTVLGVGSGRSEHPVEAVRAVVTELRSRLGDRAVIGIAALGPRMCRLGGEVADVVQLNWMTPARIEWARRRIAEGERRGSRPAGSARVAMYVRVAIGGDAHARLTAEAERYARLPNYRTAFQAMGVEPGLVGIAKPSADGVTAALDPYKAVLDETIVRVLPATEDAEGVLTVARAAI